VSGQVSASVRRRRIGIHGPRNAGKTCFLGCLYGFRNHPDARITFSEDATLSYLASLWEPLCRQQTPGATALSLPTALTLDLLPPGEKTPTALELCDYAGALMQAVPPQTSALTRDLCQGARGWFHSCQAVLLFLDSTRPDLEQLDAIDLLLTELGRPGKERPRLERPLALVLTKWDSQGAVSGDLASEQQRAREFLTSHHAFRQVYERFREMEGDRAQIFPVSAFGNGSRDNLPPPLDRFVPCHLHAPLLWAARAADEALLDEAREEARSHLERAWTVLGAPVLSTPDHEGAIRVYQKLKSNYGAISGPLAEGIEAELTSLRDNRRQHWVPWLVGGLLGVLVLAALPLLLGQHLEENSFRALQEFRTANFERDQARQRLEQEDHFLGSWWGHLAQGDRRQVIAWRRIDQAFVQEEDAQNAVLATGKQLESEGRWQDAILAYQAFLEEYPLTGERGQFSHRIDQARKAAADQQEYDALRKAALGGTPANFEDCARRCRAYLERPGAPRFMADEVRRWLSWFETLRTGGEFKVEVQRVLVPAESALLPMFGSPNIRVRLQINGKEFTTEVHNGKNPAIHEELGPFPYHWGEPGEMKVSVEAVRRFTSNVKASGSVTDPKFILARANDDFVTTCPKGKQVVVRLHCPAAVPPQLPAYRPRG
jgi:hypothetical protein